MDDNQKRNEEYLTWFYKYVIDNIFDHDDNFECKMIERYHRTTDKVAPSNIGF